MRAFPWIGYATSPKLLRYCIGLRPEAVEKAARMTDDPIIDIDPSAPSDDGK